LRNLEQADKDWRAGKKGKPKFKKKGVADSFYLESSIRISGDCIKVPILGWLKCTEVLPSVTPKNVTISCRAGRWYISFKVEVPEGQAQPTCRRMLGKTRRTGSYDGDWSGYTGEPVSRKKVKW
jgi:putative transposase